ncbi:CHAD domain-containing protein [Terricaulis sp.]|uniref:CHAD domain-containing protein n=1 Tax=Terricaulis sp. TaxID=2768686 RepID=UPI00378302F8
MMRSPAAAFDLRAALSDEVRAAISELEKEPLRPKIVHRCRVRLKRARALSRIGGNCAPGLAKVFNDSARTLMRSLAQERELASLADAARVCAKKAKKRESAALEAVAETLERAREQIAPMNLETIRAGLKDLLALAQVWPEASPRQVARGAERIARRARRARRRGRESDTPARRHEWRKREKDRLYAVELLNGAWPDDRRRRRKTGERLADALGHERDALLLIARIEADPALAGGHDGAKRALKAMRQRRAKLGARADAIGRDLHAGHA